MSRDIVKRREGKDGFGLVSVPQNMIIPGSFAFLPWYLSRSQGITTVPCRSRGGHRLTGEY